MGVATAAIVGRDHAVVLCDVRSERLESAVATLADQGIDATPVHCDVTDRDAVSALFATAAEIGELASVIHAAGVSPSMGDAEYIVRTNALGTVNVGEAFFAAAGSGAALVNVASMAAHLLPAEIIPTQRFPSALRKYKDIYLSSGYIGTEEIRNRIKKIGRKVPELVRESSAGSLYQ